MLSLSLVKQGKQDSHLPYAAHATFDRSDFCLHERGVRLDVAVVCPKRRSAAASLHTGQSELQEATYTYA